MLDFSIREELYNCFNLREFTILENRIPFLSYLSTRITGLHLWLFIFVAFMIVLNVRNSREIKFEPTIVRSVITVIFVVWSVLSFSGISTFLYFNF